MPTALAVERPALPADAAPLPPGAQLWRVPGLRPVVELWLLGQRAVWWPEQRWLLVADLHLGKDAAFRALGVGIPHTAMQADLARLSDLCQRLPVRQLVVLGDLVHSREGQTATAIAAFAEWRAAHRELPVALVPGNHDRHAGPPPAPWAIELWPGPTMPPHPFALCHEPPASAPAGRIALAGHLHPGIRLRIPGANLTAVAPCFWWQAAARCLVLPAFGAFTGQARVAPQEGDAVWGLSTTPGAEAAFALPPTA